MHYLKVRRNGNNYEARICEQVGHDHKNQKEIYVRKSQNLIIEGFSASGKSLIFNKFLEKGTLLYKLHLIYLKSTDSLSDIFYNNGITKAELEGEFCTSKKEQLLIAKAKNSLLIVDNVDKFTGKKLELLKSLVRECKKYIFTTLNETTINPTIRKITRKKSEAQIVALTSLASKDATNYLFVAFICLIALLGFYEVAILITAGRLAMRGVKIW